MIFILHNYVFHQNINLINPKDVISTLFDILVYFKLMDNSKQFPIRRTSHFLEPAFFDLSPLFS